MTETIPTIFALGVMILLSSFIAVLGVVSALAGRGEITERMRAYAFVPETEPQSERGRRRVRFMRMRLRLDSMLSAFAPSSLNMQLASANWPITITELMLIRFGVTILGLLLGWLLFSSPLSGLGLAVIAYIIPGVILRRSISQRRQRFSRQLVDVLVLVNGAVRAGYSLLQALDVVVKEMEAPASEEFRRVRREVGLGLPLNEALSNLTERMQNDDLNMVVVAININTKVGGNLATMLVSVTETIRERTRLFSEVRVLTSHQRYTAYLLTLIPFLLGGVLFMLNPEYMGKLFEPGATLCVPIVAVLGVLMGNLVIRRLAKIEV